MKDVVLFCVFYNEVEKLPFFLEYYYGICVRFFVLIDNNSDDGSLHVVNDFKNKYNDLELVVISEKGSYANSHFGTDWIKKAADLYAKKTWCLVVDADELLVYRGIETTTIQSFLGNFDPLKTDVIPGFLLDMYGRNHHIRYNGGNFFTHHPYFEKYNPKYINQNQGGMRKRMMGFSPCLRKVPLWYNGGRIKTLNAHSITKEPPAKFHTENVILCHFKLLRTDMEDYIKYSIRRDEHWNHSREYKIYEKKKIWDLNVFSPRYSVKWVNSNHLQLKPYYTHKINRRRIEPKSHQSRGNRKPAGKGTRRVMKSGNGQSKPTGQVASQKSGRVRIKQGGGGKKSAGRGNRQGMKRGRQSHASGQVTQKSGSIGRRKHPHRRKPIRRRAQKKIR